MRVPRRPSRLSHLFCAYNREERGGVGAMHSILKSAPWGPRQALSRGVRKHPANGVEQALITQLSPRSSPRRQCHSLRSLLWRRSQVCACHFCNEIYEVGGGELQELIRELSPSAA